jgi:glutamate carboxypeptidase
MRKTFFASLLLLGGVSSGVWAQATAPDAKEAAMVRAVDAETPAAVALLEKIVDINSGTMNLPGVLKVKDVIEPELVALGFKTLWVPMEQLAARAGDLVAEHPCAAGSGKCGKRLLLIGHMDTVFEPGSTFQQYSIVPGTDGKIATGPGVADMKGGLVIMLTALKAMRAAGALDNAEITIVLSGDEEKPGHPLSVARKDMIDAARHSDVALEFENAMQVDGVDAVRIGRRSAIQWQLETSGKSGHSSQIFNETYGYGAVYEIARIIDQFRTELPEKGLTFNVGLLVGGATAKLNEAGTEGTITGKTNVISPMALALGDIRTVSNEQTERVEAKMKSIVSDHLAKTGAVIAFEENYPAMAETDGSRALVGRLNEVNRTLGLPASKVSDVMSGGAGDIAFVAPYIPGLVGVGMQGAGAHAEGETAFLESLPRQAKRMALLMYRLGKN